jgi:hypothetical protein
MASEAQIAANRANAQLSTGPKDTSKTRFNGVRHGLTARHLILPWEHEEDLDAVHEAFENRFQPVDDFDRLQVKLAAESYWRVLRSLRIDANILLISANGERKRSGDPDSKDFHMGNLEALAFLNASKEMERFRRYEAHLHKLYKEALERVGKLASLRRSKSAAPLPRMKPREIEQNPHLRPCAAYLPLSRRHRLQVVGVKLPPEPAKT